MANVVIVERKVDLFRDTKRLFAGSRHLVGRVEDIDEVIDGGLCSNGTLVIINKQNSSHVRHAVARISLSQSPLKFLVVVNAPDFVELEYTLRAGAIDYIKREDALNYLHGLLDRFEGAEPDENPAHFGVGDKFKIIGDSPQIRTCLNTMAKASTSDVSVLIHGETGTGKELFARAIHGLSHRRNENLIVVDCASLPVNLVESMLFGYAKGAFTGADATSEGLIMRAHKGTLFLDEVSEIPYELQKKFLRILQERRFRPIGGKHERESDFRLVAATNKDLSKMVGEGLFRSDLLYRIQALKLNIPPLRQRLMDLPKLVAHLLKKSCDKNRVPLKKCSREFFDILERHDWPGNVRELENVLDSVVAISLNQPKLHPELLPAYIRVKAARLSVSAGLPPQPEAAACGIHEGSLPANAALTAYKTFRTKALESIDRHYFQELHRATGGDMVKAMAMAGLSRARIYEFYKKCGLSKAFTRTN